MTRSKRPRRAAKRPARRPAPPPAKPARPSPAETELLALARTLTTFTGAERSPRAALTRALDVLALAFQAGAPLPRALAHARTAALRDETRALAIAWAREQLRLSLGEVLARAAAAGELRVALPVAPLAWLVLAACEALADEPLQAAPDRLRLLAEWLTDSPTWGA
jgi:hypothetical protein